MSVEELKEKIKNLEGQISFILDTIDVDDVDTVRIDGDYTSFINFFIFRSGKILKYPEITKKLCEIDTKEMDIIIMSYVYFELSAEDADTARKCLDYINNIEMAYEDFNDGDIPNDPVIHEIIKQTIEDRKSEKQYTNET